MTPPEDVIVQKDQVYAQAGRPLLWDVYAPATPAARRPVVLLLHGGGWRMGDRVQMAEAATMLAQGGFVAIAPEYRLLGELAWPGPLRDVRTAVAAVRTHADALDVDPDHLFLMGFSAGAHLALLAAAAPPAGAGANMGAEHRPPDERAGKVAGVAAFFPVTRVSPRQAEQLGLGVGQIDEVSPLNHASSLPPTIIFCGDADPITPVAQSTELHAAINAAGGIADLRLYAGLVHEFVALPGMKKLAIQDAVAFFDRTVISRAAFGHELEKLKAWWVELLGGNGRAQNGA